MKRALRWLLAAAVAGAAMTAGAASANHGTGMGHSYTFVQPGFPQEIVGSGPGFYGGVAFAPDGDPWVDFCQFSGAGMRRFDLQSTPPDVNATKVHSFTDVTSGAGCGLTNHPDGFIYSNIDDATNGVAKLDANTGALVSTMGPPGNALGITVDPQTDRLVYVAQDCRFTGTCTIISLNPADGTSTTFATVPGTTANFLDGVAFDPTGTYLFASNRAPFGLLVLKRDGSVVQNVPISSEPDGISFHATTPKFVVTNNNDGTMTRFDFAADDYTQTPTVSTFASGGFRGDLTQVGPDGCIYITQDGTRFDNDVTSGDDSLVRLCGGFAPPRGVPDTTPPSCALTATIVGPPKQLKITAQDTGSGLQSIVVTSAVNTTVSIPLFSAGTQDPVVVTATKVNQTKSSSVALRVTDRAGNSTNCDPVLTSLIRDDGSPTPPSETFTGLPAAESTVTILNGDPGLKTFKVVVNGVKFKEGSLAAGETRVVDVAAAMSPGSNNTITISARGQKGASATVVISD